MFRFLPVSLLLLCVACSARNASVASYGPPPRVSEPTPTRTEELNLILGDDLTEEEEDLRAIHVLEYDPPAEARPPALDDSMRELMAEEGALLVEEEVDYDIPIVLNARVEWWVNYFSRRIRSSFERYLIRSGAWLPYLTAQLAEAGLPRDLAFIVLIESGFSTQARSRANAVGPWQFIASTGREYGLRIDRWIDERRDYERATQAAIAYLSDLHAMFGSWHLAAAGYNGGQGRIQRSMVRDNAASFWELRSIRDETRNYVPKLLAATIVAKQPTRYGFGAVPYLEPARWAKVLVPAGTDLDAVAEKAEVPTEMIQALNPHILRGRTPPGEPNFPVKIPHDRAEVFARNVAEEGLDRSIGTPLVHPAREGETVIGIASAYGVPATDLAHANGIGVEAVMGGDERLIVPGRFVRRAVSGPGGSEPDLEEVRPASRVQPEPTRIHRVRRGDTLYKLARRYGVSVSAIRQINGLRSDRIIVGQRLTIPDAR